MNASAQDLAAKLLAAFMAPTSTAGKLATEKSIRHLYGMAGLPTPRKIIWCPSPMAMIVAQQCLEFRRKALNGSHPERPVPPGAELDTLRNAFSEEMPDAVWQEAAAIHAEAIAGGCLLRPRRQDAAQASYESMKIRNVMSPVRQLYHDACPPGMKTSAAAERRANTLRWHLFRMERQMRCTPLITDALNLEFEYDFLSFLKGIETAAPTPQDIDSLAVFSALSRHVGWISDYAGMCWVTPRSLVARFGDGGNLHCENGPALAYEGAWAVYAIRGARVPRYVVENPSLITIDAIENTMNAELRRAMTAQYRGNYLRDCGADLMAQDPLGALYRKPRIGDNDIVFVRVINSTPDPDGSSREYFLRVPPTVKTPTEGIAWSFDMTPEEYLKTQKMT